MRHGTYEYVMSHMSGNAIVKMCQDTDGVATTSRLLKIIGLFCKSAL